MNLPIRKYLALAALTAASLSTASAVTVVDDFNRADTGLQGSNPNAIGADWTIQSGAWEILNQRLTDPTGGIPGIITWNSLQTSNTSGNLFSISSTMALAQSGGLVMGVTFNFQDMNNYYAFRFNPSEGFAQWLVVSGGSESAIFTATDLALQVGRDYRVTVSSDAAYTASFEIYDTVTNSVVFSQGATEDGNHLFSNGYGGLYSNFTSPVYSFDSFSLTASMPEPSTYVLLGLSAGMFVLIARRRVTNAA